ncbi:COX15/CtaA family protein [Edaphocola aurantiacus]|uniref:COX15/CtaA family protein n=1 Tax=Edaphocola aurantiacus TaxID=2601682 RepID=UPI001C945736|nr:COX15/CtaA family protein [Edaphocola aurantiacus]
MIENYSDQERKNKIVAYWLLTGVFMIIIQTLLGGITRLSGSGLSITEWNVVTGTLPPMNQDAWAAEFAKYQQSPQFKYLNQDFTVSDFKFIFFWEWFHRLWARLIGFVFAIPFIYFLVKKYFTREMVLPIFGMFALGALQGAIGWIMVASGLVGDAIYVRPTKLAMHFVFAMILACYVLWFALKLLVPNTKRVLNPALSRLTIVMLVLLFIQLTYGALMAGHKAATVAATWPTINGMWVPDNMTASPSGHYLLENKITIHFIHRGLAYLLFALILIYTVKAAKIRPSAVYNRQKWYPMVLVSIQVLLGIFTVLSSTTIQANRWRLFETIAELHQLVAMFLMLSLVVQVYLVRTKPVVAG